MLINILIAAQLVACPVLALTVDARMNPNGWRRRIAGISRKAGRRS